MKTCMYLRKSRADEELEKINSGNTLNRHKESLLKIAESNNLVIVKIHEEIVSGESLAQRPAMLKLLEEVGNNEYDAVIVMDMDRLGRGNMQEQGLILETFKQSKTKIVTPRKTYDLENEFDEEYSEFEAFMARKELKIITRRMQRGRLKSIEEGKYIGTYAPYGYKLVGQGRDRHLIIDDVAAHAIKFIFQEYAKGNGGTRIATQLNSMGYKTATGKQFYSHSILNIIKNPTYTGKVTWKKKTTFKGDLNKRRTVKLNDKEDWIIHEGKHMSIISEELFNICQSQLTNKTHVPYNTKLTNPLAGIVICSNCKKPMVYRPYTTGLAHIICPNSLCTSSKSSRFDLVEDKLLLLLDELLNSYSITPVEINEEKNNITDQAIKNIHLELIKLNTQKSNLHDLLEQGVYDIDTFLNRSDLINTNIAKLEVQLSELNNKQSILSDDEKYEVMHTIIEAYKKSDDVVIKNQLLKKLIESVVYTKKKDAKPNDFNLEINLRI